MGSFAELTFDVTLWLEELRFGLGMLVAFIGVIYTFVVAVEL